MAATSDALISQVVEQEEDRLGKLQDDVLVSILKRMDLRDAVRSSILSRRWRHIPGLLPDIVLDVESFKPNDDDGFQSTVSDTARSNMALAQAAKSLLGRKSQNPIKYLDVTFYLRPESTGIVRAVDDAMSEARGRGVLAAEFTILAEKLDTDCTESDMVRQGKRFLSYFSACPRAFAGLTALHVESVKLGPSDIPKVLGTCQKLERLSLHNCDSWRGTVLPLEHPQLTELKLVMCDAVELKRLPKLVQVTCCCWVPSQNGYPLSFGHVPRLRRLMLSTTGYVHYPTLRLSELLASYATLGELYLNFESNRIWIQPEGPEQLAPLLQNLRIVNLEKIYEECDLTWTLFLLQAAPLLKMLQIRVLSHECASIQDEELKKIFFCEKTNMKWEISDSKHYNLAVLDIYGFQPDNKFMGYIRRVMRAAVNLEVIALNDECCVHCGICPETRYPRTKEERDLIRKQINEGITSPVNNIQFYEVSSEGRRKIVD